MGRSFQISSNGLVTFDAPLRRFADAGGLGELGLVGIAPHYARSDLPNRGAVVFQETTGMLLCQCFPGTSDRRKLFQITAA